MPASSDSTQVPFLKSALTVAIAAACLWAGGADAQRGGHGQSGGRPVAGSHGGGHGQWQGRHGGGRQWHGSHVNGGHRWHGGGQRWHGGGHRWRGHGYGHGHNWYPFAWGVGAGVALTYPWWGWGYPYGYYVYESPYYVERPVGVVIEERSFDAAPPRPASPGYRWYCPSPAGYHPDVRECSQGWLKVVPEDVQPGSPPG